LFILFRRIIYGKRYFLAGFDLVCSSSEDDSKNNKSSHSNTDKIVDSVYEYFTSTLGDDSELAPEKEFKGIVKDFVVCLDKAGVKVESAKDIEKLDDEADEGAAECYADFQDDVEELFAEQ